MRSLKKLTLSMAAALLATAALAAGSDNGTTITAMETDGSGNTAVFFAANTSGGPPCATNNNGMVIPASNVNLIAAASLAFALTSTVNASGTARFGRLTRPSLPFISNWRTICSRGDRHPRLSWGKS